MNVLIIGCGSIGTTVAEAAQRMSGVGRIYVHDTKPETERLLASKFSKCVQASVPSEHMDDIQLVVESASVQSALSIVPQYLGNGKDVLVMSVGAFADDNFTEKCAGAFGASGARVIIPSGAIGGIDAVSAAKEGGLASVTLTTVKPPAGFAGSPQFVSKGLKPEDVKERMIVFKGSAREAIRAFPKNVNVAVTLSLAGLGLDRTMVRVVADPAEELNTHQIKAEGEFGSMSMTFRNQPFRENPRTSMLAALSAVSVVRKLSGRFWVGV